MGFRITNQKLIDDFIDFVNSISNKDRIAILHDADADGISSAIILEKSLERLNKNVVFTTHEVAKRKKLDEEIYVQMKKKKVTHVFVLDMAMDMTKDSIAFLKEFKAVEIDHHPNGEFLDKSIIFIKPQFFTDLESPIQYCTAKLVYDLMSRVARIDDLEWLAVVGVVGDYAWKLWHDFLRANYKKNKMEWNDYLYDTIPGEVTKLISAAAAINDEALVKAEKLLSRSKGFEDACKKLNEFSFVNEKIEYYINNFEKLADHYCNENLLILELKEELNISSPIATGTSTKRLKGPVLILFEDRGERIKISSRNNSGDWDCNKLMKICVEGLDGNGGGHPASSGANVIKEQFPVFKERLMDAIKNKSVKINKKK